MRGISAEWIGVTPVRTDSTNTLGRWNHSIAAPDPSSCSDAPTPSTFSTLCGGGYADQDTTLGPDSIAGSLRATAWDGNETLGGAASAVLAVSFELPLAQSVLIAGSWGVTGHPCCGGDGSMPAAGLTLRGPSGTVYTTAFSPSSTTLAAPIGFRGRLAAGSYSLSAIASETFRHVGSNENGRTATVVVTLDLCRADFNLSGAVTVQDIFDFLNAYFSNSPTANFNNTGGLSVQDIFDFLAAFFAGC